jgi:alpha-beta hydrolase superfamily lysophospholipase
MMALVKAVRDSDLARFQAPVLVHYSEQDQTVSPARIKAAFARLGSPQKQLVPVEIITNSLHLWFKYEVAKKPELLFEISSERI